MGGSGQQAGGGARASELRECVRAACEGAGGRRGRPVGGCRRAAGWLRRGGRSVPERDGACLPGAVETDRECHPDAVCVLCRRRAPRRTERPGTQDCEHLKSGWWWTSADFGDGLIGTAFPPNYFKTYSNDSSVYARGDSYNMTANSFHPGGVNVCMADGSVKFIKDSVSSWPAPPASMIRAGDRNSYIINAQYGVWQALSTINGGEVISADAY